MEAEEKGLQEKPKVRLLWPRTGRDWVILVLAAFFVLGIVGNLLPQGPKEVQVGQVRLEVPEGWEAKEVQGGWALLSPLEGPKDTFRENLTLLREPLPQPMAPVQYAQVVAWRNAQGMSGFVPGPVHRVSLGGIEAVAFSGRGQYGGRALEFWIWAFVVGQEGYQLTLTGEPGKLAQIRPQVETVLASLEVPAVGSAPAWPGPGPGQRYGAPPPGSPPMPGAPQSRGVPAFPAPGDGGMSGPYGYGFGEMPEGYSPDLPGGAWDFSGDSGLEESLQEHRDFNTWMAEEWSQMLSGETPEPTHQDEAGNLYWEGPSGLLHEWGDYGGE